MFRVILAEKSGLSGIFFPRSYISASRAVRIAICAKTPVNFICSAFVADKPILNMYKLNLNYLRSIFFEFGSHYLFNNVLCIKVVRSAKNIIHKRTLIFRRFVSTQYIYRRCRFQCRSTRQTLAKFCRRDRSL